MFPKHFRDYPGGVESYDVYSPPITTRYSQVWWAPLAPSDLGELKKKYNGKKVAIVGWEIDQVQRTPHGDVSVPISATYNHHYVAQLIGKSARFKKIFLSGPDDPRAAEIIKNSHGHIAFDQPHYVVEQVGKTADNGDNPYVSSANGGESFHGFPPGFAKVVDSPSALQISPMQIDTWNRAEV